MPDRIYLDACVLNRPRDNQGISRNRHEAVALEAILDLAAAGKPIGLEVTRYGWNWQQIPIALAGTIRSSC